MVIVVAASFGTAMVVFGFSRNFYLSVLAMFVLGLSPPFWLAGIRTILQTTIPDEMRGRVMAVFLLGMQSCGLGWPLGGALAEVFSNEAAIAGAGGLFILLNLLAYVRSAALRNA
jgi:predicted MFS family arabinose efflux permease